jgi:hypothetical protein
LTRALAYSQDTGIGKAAAAGDHSAQVLERAKGHRLFAVSDVTSLAGFLGGAGGGVGALFGWAAEFAPLLMGGGIAFGTGALLFGGALGGYKVATALKPDLGRTVTEPNLRPALELFASGGELDRAVLAVLFRRLLQTEQDKKCKLTEPARTALQGAVKRADSLPPEVKEHATQLLAITEAFDPPKKKLATKDGLKAFVRAYERASEEVRQALRPALFHVLFDGKKSRYKFSAETKETLFNLLRPDETAADRRAKAIASIERSLDPKSPLGSAISYEEAQEIIAALATLPEGEQPAAKAEARRRLEGARIPDRDTVQLLDDALKATPESSDGEDSFLVS